MIKVSVIVPIYNAEKYLKQCLESIQRQTLKDIEVIMIDDGSTDGGSEIAKSYLSDNRFSYYYKEKDWLQHVLTVSNAQVVNIWDSLIQMTGLNLICTKRCTMQLNQMIRISYFVTASKMKMIINSHLKCVPERMIGKKLNNIFYQELWHILENEGKNAQYDGVIGLEYINTVL